MSLAPRMQGAPIRRASLGTLAHAVLALAAVGVTLATALVHQETISVRSDLGGVAFGLPLGWLVQDQSSLDPPFPVEATIISPWEYPASVALFPLAFDVFAVYAVLLLGMFLVRFTPRHAAA